VVLQATASAWADALSLTSRTVRTQIIQFQFPHGTAFFGPVTGRLPGDVDAPAQLRAHVVIPKNACSGSRFRPVLYTGPKSVGKKGEPADANSRRGIPARPAC